MSYIAPNTVVKFIRNCPLESSYQNTLWFDTKAHQTEYFNSIVKYPASKYTLSAQSYQRAGKGSIRVSLEYEDLVDCNYMMFNNQSFENKWFYAFITSVEYISNAVTQIYYTIDVIQTWFFDYTMRQCFVEREHTATDNAGEHLVPEDLDIGDYILVSRIALDQPANLSEPNKIVFVSSVDINLDDVTAGSIIDNVYNPLQYIVFNANTAGLSSANAFLANLVNNNKIDAILAVYMAPPIVNSAETQGMSSAVPKKGYTGNSTLYDNLDGYVPKNKKLFNAPYNILHVVTDASSIDLAYEYFTPTNDLGDNYVWFSTFWTLIPSPTVVAYPNNYRRQLSLGVHNFEARLAITDFPQCAISADVYKIWLSQNEAQLGVKTAFAKFDIAKGAWNGAMAGWSFGKDVGATVGDAIGDFVNLTSLGIAAELGVADEIGKSWGGTLGGVAGGVAGGLIGAYDYSRDIKMLMAQHHDISTKPPEVRGSQTSIADFSLGIKRLYADQMTIRADYAQRIDSYFDMFGYKVNVVKTPSIHNRSLWTYVKTVGCLIDGAMPADDESAICKIFDSGIRFWTDPTKMGDYSYTNAVLTTPTTPTTPTT